MIDRQLAWSEANVAALLERFVPCADEVWRLQNTDAPDALVFRSFCDQGHYRDRPKSATRQGIYAITPAGELLGSWNTRRPEVVERNLLAALARWDAMDEAERLPEEDLFGPISRAEDAYPVDGLALRAFTRDLPREDGTEGWRGRAWNLDHAWFSAAEARALAEEGKLPERAADRLVRIHTRDNVRGQTRPFPKGTARAASLTSEVVEEREGEVDLVLTGAAHTVHTGEWRTQDRGTEPSEQTRSFEGTMYGRATWNGERFTRFELAIAGTRTGATRYNGRRDDPGPAPMAIVLRVAPEHDRVAPSMFWEYGWRIPPPSDR